MSKADQQLGIPKGVIKLLTLQKRAKRKQINNLVCPVCSCTKFKKELYGQDKYETLYACQKCTAILDCWDYTWYKKPKDFPTKPLLIIRKTKLKNGLGDSK